jgi:hypothetical protein
LTRLAAGTVDRAKVIARETSSESEERREAPHKFDAQAIDVLPPNNQNIPH